MVFVALIVLVIVLLCIILMVRRRKRVRIPMYPQYINLNTGQIRWTSDQKYGYASYVCPWCRKKFCSSTIADYWGPFCKECSKEIHAKNQSEQRPACVAEKDWRYLKDHRDSKYWIIYRDYELNRIDQQRAQSLMHSLVPDNFGKIKPIKYRGSHDYTKLIYSHLDSAHEHLCEVCHKLGSCECKKLYAESIRLENYPKPIKPHLDKLRELNPELVITGYYMKDGKMHAKTQSRQGFRLEDYFTFDDWQAINWILNFSSDENYDEEDIEEALKQYTQLIVADLEVLVEFYERINHGGRPPFPFLPSTDPESVEEIRAIQEQKTRQERITKEFIN